jgi:hypothetical protein
MIYRFIILTMMSILTSLHVLAESLPPESQRLSLKKGTEITVSKYMKEANAFEITINQEQGVGPNIATPEALQKAIGMEGQLKKFQAQMERDIGSIYVLSKDLPLLWDEEVDMREKKAAKKK